MNRDCLGNEEIRKEEVGKGLMEVFEFWKRVGFVFWGLRCSLEKKAKRGRKDSKLRFWGAVPAWCDRTTGPCDRTECFFFCPRRLVRAIAR